MSRALAVAGTASPEARRASGSLLQRAARIREQIEHERESATHGEPAPIAVSKPAERAATPASSPAPPSDASRASTPDTPVALPATAPDASDSKKKALQAVLEPQELHPELAIRTLLRSLPDLPDSIELPAHIFRLLRDNLSLLRAALLLPDYDEDIFVPWASVGLDATTLHRLRVPTADLQATLQDGGAGLVWVGDDCREFAPYFSRREAAMLDHLLVFPIFDDDQIEAALFVTDTEYFESHLDQLRIILAAVGEPAARAMREQRITYASTMRQSIVFKPAEIPVVAQRIAPRATNGIRVVLIQLADVVSQVATANDHLDPYRVWQDVLRACAAFFASTASVCDADDHRALLLLHGPADEDVDLIVQHVAASLTALLPEIYDAPVLRYTSRRYPDDGDDLPALIQSIL